MECSMYQVFSCLILLTIIHSGIYAQQLIGPTPETQAVLISTDHTLTCRRGDGGESGSIVFSDATDPDADPTNVFINGGKETNDLTTPKYSNFNSDSANPYDVVITNIAVEDEGTYTCRNNFYSLTITAIRTVEVPLSAFDLTQDGSGTELVTVQAGVPSDIVCTAIGARPVVTILWFHAKDGGSETPITEGINQVETVNGDTTDSVSTLTYTATDDYDAGSLICKTTGQLVAESREDTASLNVQYVPVIDELSYADNTVTCKPRGNPEITQVRIYVNGTEYTPTQDGTTYTLSYTVKEEITIRCNATNTLGTGTDTVLAEPGIPTTVSLTTSVTTGATNPPPTKPPSTGTTKKPANPSTLNVGAIVGPLVAVLVGVAVVICAVIYVKKKKNDPSSKPTPTPKPRSSSNSNEMKPVNGSQNAASNNTAEEGKKKNAEGLLYAELDHNKPPTQPNSGQNDIIRTEEATQYADVKSFIKDTT